MSKSLETLRKKAAEFFEKEKFKEIIELLTDDILEKYKDAELYAWRARAHFRLHDNPDIVMVYAQKAIDVDSNHYMAYHARSNAWYDKSEYDKAIEDYNKEIELKPDYADAYINRGLALNNKGEYDKAIGNYNIAIELRKDDPVVYNNRGIAFQNKGENDKAIADYTMAIELKKDYAIAYNNRGIAFQDKGENDKAIADYTKAIELKPDYALAFNNRGIVFYDKDEFDNAIIDYTNAIELKPDYADAYYNRGLARSMAGKELKQAINDYEKYLALTAIKDDIWAKRAKDFIQELGEKTSNPGISEIGNIVSEIKKLLLITEGCVTHYTTFSTAKILVLSDESKLRISEGSFLNDPSEGRELFNFVAHQFSKQQEDGLIAREFAAKPFIGSFVGEDKHDDLNLWRFYGKQDNVEAKGCAITLKMKELTDAINQSLTKGSERQSTLNEDDINFYRVAYLDHSKTAVNFQIPGVDKDEEDKLNLLMQALKEKVASYEQIDNVLLEKELNKIAFLFKSDVYKNENELRLVIKGIGFEKMFYEDDKKADPPRVYIDLINIRHLIEQITLGPKVDKADEWAAAFYYSFAKETDESKKPKRILVSRLPYK